MSLNLNIMTKIHYLAGAVSILGHLTGENVSEGGESIVHGLVVDTLVQVLDEHVADSRSSQRGVTLTPHDPDRATLEDIKVHGVQSTLSWREENVILIVD